MTTLPPSSPVSPPPPPLRDQASMVTVTLPELPEGAIGQRLYLGVPTPVLPAPAPQRGRLSLRARFEWKPQDCWLGVFWKGRGGHLDLWLCLVPMLPLHITLWRSPLPPPPGPTYSYHITSTSSKCEDGVPRVVQTTGTWREP